MLLSLRLFFLILVVAIYSDFAESKQDTKKFILPKLDIGMVGLPQKTVTKQLTEGVTYIQVDRGIVSEFDYYKLVSRALSLSNARKMQAKLIEQGQKSRIEALSEFGLYGKSLGVQVVIDPFESVEVAKAHSEKLSKLGFKLTVRHHAEEGYPTTGPFEISLLKIDLTKFNGQITSALGHDTISKVEPVSTIAKRHKALAAINAGFFSWSEKVGTIGDLSGISVINGSLVSEATNGRPALLLHSDKETKKVNSVEIAQNIKTHIWLTINGNRFEVGGLNRKPGKILNCGNSHATPTNTPVHDYVCSNDNEIVVFNRYFGGILPKNENGIQLSIDSKGHIQSKRKEIDPQIPTNGYVVQAVGVAAQKLAQATKVGDVVSIDMDMMSDNKPIKIEEGLYVINGGPTLLKDGLFDLSARAREGWETHFGKTKISDQFVDEKDAVSSQSTNTNRREGFYHNWVVRRHPRTAAGITNDNILYLAVVYGRQPGVSAGASLTEMTRLMKSLGAVNAINLDGGGSSVMVIAGEPTGVSSDAEGERSVGDALLIIDAESEINK